MRWAPLLIPLLLSGCPERGGPSVTPDPTKSTESGTSTTSKPTAKPKAFPALRTECKADADCGWIMLGNDCCSSCGSTVGNRGWVDEVNAFCKEKKGGPPDCPSLDCPFEPFDARCISGTCTRVPRK